MWTRVSHSQAKIILENIIRQQIQNGIIEEKLKSWIQDKIDSHNRDQFWTNQSSLALESKGDKYWGVYEWVDAYIGFHNDLEIEDQESTVQLRDSRDLHWQK